MPATNVSAATSPKKSGASSSSQARDSEEEAMKEDMKSWLTLFYFGNDCDKSESETKAQFVIVDLLFSNVSLKKLLSVFRYRCPLLYVIDRVRKIQYIKFAMASLLS